jgi:hypothetical protein
MPKTSFHDAVTGESISGSFEVHEDVITVTAADGRKKEAIIDDGWLAPEILAKSLLLLLRHERLGARRSAANSGQYRQATGAALLSDPQCYERQ